MRFASRFISAALVLCTGLFGSFVLPFPVAHAATPAGVTCNTIDGVYVCTDSSIGSTGSTCVVDSQTGKQSCMTGGQLTTGSISNLGVGFGSVSALPGQAGGSGWLSRMTEWFAYAIHGFFASLVQVLKDLVTFVVGVVLGLVASAIASISPPDWLSQYSMGTVLGQTGPIVGFFMTAFQIPASLALVGAGYAFRLLRKFLTLFQW